MEKPKILSKTLKKTTIQETVGNSFTKYLNAVDNTQDARNIFNFMIKQLITEKGVPYISVEDYINFFKRIPLKYWSEKPIFYQKDGKFDALGFLGERVHAFTLITKTLDLYFQDGLNMHITHVLDNKEPKFINIKNPKERLLTALEYLKENTSKGDLNRAFHKAKAILHGRYY